MNFITPDTLYLCIDQGGHASRAIVFNHEGVMVGSAYCDVNTEHPAKYFVEHDANEVITSIKNSIHQVLEKLGDKKKHIVSAGLATQRSNVVCWNKKTGEALSPVISWQDRRNHEWLKQFDEKNEYIHKKTGLFLSPHYGASKLRWCLDNIPEVKTALNNNTLVFGPMSSFISYHLTKEKFLLADPVNASRTQLWNLKTHHWDDELLELFDIPVTALPYCVPSIHVYGTIELDEFITPLRLVSGDQSAAMYAYGQLQPDTAYINTGTGAFLSRSSGPLALYSRRLLTSLIFRDSELKGDSQNHFVLEGTVNGAGSALEWLSHQYPDSHLFRNLPGWLNEVEIPPLFLNAVSGLAAPFWLPDLMSKFNQEANVKEKAVAIVESIIFLLITCLEEMCKLHSPPEQIQITGGLASLDELNQRLADLSGLPVYRPTECEATARGTAYLLADHPTHWPEQDAGTWFDPEENTELKKRYKNWTTLMHEEIRK
ncbi:MAG: FGGY family carbohydrate kinase [Gammaproteobacteria bacterium]|nr:FGGY family carbohydrate kinase [Gammaproteobacteria bacterium]